MKMKFNDPICQDCTLSLASERMIFVLGVRDGTHRLSSMDICYLDWICLSESVAAVQPAQAHIEESVPSPLSCLR